MDATGTDQLKNIHLSGEKLSYSLQKYCVMLNLIETKLKLPYAGLYSCQNPCSLSRDVHKQYMEARPRPTAPPIPHFFTPAVRIQTCHSHFKVNS
jgi:hypothetical protein